MIRSVTAWQGARNARPSRLLLIAHGAWMVGAALALAVFVWALLHCLGAVQYAMEGSR